MKKTIYLIAILFSISIYSQEYSISNFEKADYEKNGDELRKKLNIQDKNTLIIKSSNRYVSFEKDGLFKQEIDTIENRLVYKEKISKSDSTSIIKYLNSIILINPQNLNIVEDKSKAITVQDGPVYKMEFFKNHRIFKLSTTSPEIYIENKFPYYEDRLLFVEFYKIFDTVFYDKYYQKLLHSKTLYLFIDMNKRSHNDVDYYLKKEKKKKSYIFTFSKKNKIILNYFKQSGDSIKMIEEKHNGRIETIDLLALFGKYRYENIINILSLKKVYIVNNKNFKKRNTTIRRVYFEKYPIIL